MSAPNSLTFPDHTYVDGYLHKIYGYRYNWHKNAYEIDIVLKGTLEFCRGGEKIILHQDDFLIVDPGIGHASYPLEPDTVTLVLHFSARALADSLADFSKRAYRQSRTLNTSPSSSPALLLPASTL